MQLLMYVLIHMAGERLPCTHALDKSCKEGQQEMMVVVIMVVIMVFPVTHRVRLTLLLDVFLMVLRCLCGTECCRWQPPH
jgi:hypothetical protein